MSDASVPVLQARLATLRAGRPYPGFRPFRRDEWPIFFGRDRQVQSLLRLLADHHFICLHGPSGCGKSSLIEAGLIATLEREHRRLDTAWCTATFRPGTSPVWNLARGLLLALRPGSEPELAAVVEAHSRLVRPGGSVARAARESGLARGDNLLLVADQFEELFRFRALGDAREALRFVDLLLDVFDEQPEGIHVVIATRTDFLGDFSEIVGLAEASNAAQFLTPALTEDELRAAIRGPAELHGDSVEDALVEALIEESANQPDRLPILQHALMRCWNVAESGHAPRRLTLAVYRSDVIRGVREALDRHAEEVMASPELRGLAREVELTFRALTELDGQRRAIRRPLPWGQLLAETGSPPPAEQSTGTGDALPLERVVNCFRAESTGFLGRPRPEETTLKPDTVVDIAHEALIRRWRRMNRAAAPPTASPPLDESPQRAGTLIDRGGQWLRLWWSRVGRRARSSTAVARQRDGWLWDQLDDENLYRALLVDAYSADSVISPANLQSRLPWWRRQPRTLAWARRMSGNRDATEQDAQADIAQIEDLFERSVRARVRRRWLNGVVAVATAVLLLLPFYVLSERARTLSQRAEVAVDQAAKEKAYAQRSQEDLTTLLQVRAQLDETRRQLADTQAALARATGQAREPAADRAVSPPTAAPLPARPGPAPVDWTTEIAAAARPLLQSAAPASSLAGQGCEGAVWIGSSSATNLEVGSGSARHAATLGEVQANTTFVSAKNLRLRKGLPRPDGYVQQEAIGIVPIGAQLTALGEPVRYDRPAGPQYWLKVRVPSAVCSLVYFQFANGTADNALALAKALEANGYLVPGQEQLNSAVGAAEVRYYYAANRSAAEQLAKDAMSDASKLGLARNRDIKVKDLTGWSRGKPPRGTLELWLDLSSG